MEKIIPHLWFDQEVEEAVEFYLSLFEHSEVQAIQKLEGTPAGDNALSYTFTLAGQSFAAINGGPVFEFNPSISFTVLGETKDEIQTLWDQLVTDGNVLMDLKAYSFSEYYGWVEDKFGVSWQLVFTEGKDYKQKIIPSLTFSGPETGKANEAIDFYVDIFQKGQRGETHEYPADEANHPEAKISHATFELMEEELIAADNGEVADYTFNEAVSIMVSCVTQSEIDYYWEKLSAVPEAEQCGWLKDKYGVSWQIVPHDLTELLESGTRKQINAVTEAFLEMKKLDMERLERIWESAK